MIRGLPQGERWALISDIHANAGAFAAALRQAEGADRFVVLGDLLTYGVEPGRCIDLLAELVARRPTDLVLGNHDQLYRDLLAGDTSYYDRLPGWLRETVDWTLERVDPAWFDELPWAERIVHDDVLIAHANPWDFGDWRYLNTEDDAREAQETLRRDGFRLGLFGHTHRPMLYSKSGVDGGRVDLSDTETRPIVLNPGSVGQPRTRDKAPSFATIERNGGELVVSEQTVDYHVAAHLGALSRSGLSAGTLERLLRYFPPPQAP